MITTQVQESAVTAGSESGTTSGTAAATAEDGQRAAAAAACWQLSKVMRQGLVDYNLVPTARKLAQLLVLESFDEGRLVGRCDFERWAARILPLEQRDDGKVIARPDRCKALMEDLQGLGLVDWNMTQGTFELRPFPGSWSKLAERERHARQKTAEAEPEFPLRAERPLSEALSELSRQMSLDQMSLDSMRCAPPRPEPEIADTRPSPGDPLSLQGRRDQDRTLVMGYARVKAAIDGPTTEEDQTETAEADSRLPVAEFATEPLAESATNGMAKFATEKTSDLPGNSGVAKFATRPKPTLATLAIAQLSSCTKAELSSSYRPEVALRWLEEQDRKGTLRKGFRSDYEAMCEQHPDYVLTKLKWWFEEHLAYMRKTKRNEEYFPVDPVGLMGRVASDAGMMRWRGRRQ